jgi:hypothetical protein
MIKSMSKNANEISDQAFDLTKTLSHIGGTRIQIVAKK